MRRSLQAIVIAVLALGASAAPAAADEVIYGLTTGDNLVSFGSASPFAASAPVAIGGLAAAENVVGIDVRPRTGELYAVTSASRLLKVDPTSGATTVVGTFSPGLTGTSFGVDFNPVADRLRIVSNTSQNLRVNPDTAAVTVDGNLSSVSITAAAYTKNFNGTATTALYDLNTASDRLLAQNPPNDGTLMDVGPLGIDALSEIAGFDVGGAEGVAYASLLTSTALGLYRIDLTTGAATAIGPFAVPVRDIAVARQEPTGYVVSSDGSLLSSFLPSATAVGGAGPQTVTAVGSFGGLLGAGEKIVGIDVRPATGELYAVGRDNTDKGRLYKVNPATAALSQVGSGTFAVDLLAGEYGIDFNPVADRIRLVNDSDQNLRIDPNTGAVVDVDPLTPGTQSDGSLAFGLGDANFGDNPLVGAAAYSNNYAGAATTVLYDIERGNQITAIQTPPNNGTLVTQTAGGGLTATNSDVGYDITAQDNAAYGVLKPGAVSRLFRMQSGAASIATQGPQGSQLGALTDADGLTFAGSGSAGLAATAQTVAETAGSASVTITRTGGQGTINVAYVTANGTATAGADYAATAGSVTFQPGETTKTAQIPLLDDTTVEAPETLTVTLVRSAGGYVLGSTVHTITITSADVAPPPPPPPPPPAAEGDDRVATKTITARVSPSRDRRAPYRFRTSGKMTPTGKFTRAAFCKGRVTVTVKAGSKTVSTRRVSLRSDCTYRSTVSFGSRSRLGRTGRLRFTARFLGNARVKPKAARSVTVRVG